MANEILRTTCFVSFLWRLNMRLTTVHAVPWQADVYYNWLH